MGFVEHLLGDTAEQFGRLSGYLDTGKAESDRDKPTPFEAIYHDGKSVGRFLNAMRDLSYHASHELAALADLSGSRQLLDVGGASGPFSVAALHAYPRLRATEFGLPQVGPHLAMRATEHELGDRLGFAADDFFRDPLPTGDCFAYGYILSDWTTRPARLCRARRRRLPARRPGADHGAALRRRPRPLRPPRPSMSACKADTSASRRTRVAHKQTPGTGPSADR
ncbi:methyltransferase [Streptomyces drozdowiczii]|uniref:O-methyltransferase C-terminal domain-containing protein n=1 Tax=Streptomyces drozdowiczii TaxID=202862 RepID=A0ABY6PPB2_9ACTN|nr:methyltransferase [Streptomyces drozdowiczii]MCX0246586.1 hypothetical protein [Streptomyces drozdowiczii]UZK53937.1 hypothetical protein NEH16_07000 [Streptomyces drozdowiczii]